MGKTVIYAANTSPQVTTVAATNVDFGTTIVQDGCLTLSGNAVTSPCIGFYDVDVSLTATAAASGTLTAQVYLNGLPVTGATASVALAEGSVESLTIPTTVKFNCPRNPGFITVQTSGAVASITNAAIRVGME